MGGLLGGTPLGAFVLGGVNQSVVTGFQPAWASGANAVVQKGER